MDDAYMSLRDSASDEQTPLMSVSNSSMRPVAFPAPPGGFAQQPQPSAGVNIQTSSTNQGGGLSPPPEPDTQTLVSLTAQSPYQRLQSGLGRGDSKLLLGQRDFQATLNDRPSNVQLTSEARTQRGGSAVSQMFLPLPSNIEDLSAADGRSEASGEGMSKHRVRFLYVIFCAQKLFCELLGTLFLVTSIALAEKGSHAQFAPFSVSAVVYVLSFLFVPISGAHFNPAVSTAMFLTSKHFRYLEYLCYVLCQFVGGTCGALLGSAIMGIPLEILPLDLGSSSARSIFHEVIPTILLIYTCLVLTFATNAGDVSLMTIPFTASMAVLFGAIAGAMMNPAVVIGIYMSRLIVGNAHVVTREVLIGTFCPFLGAVLSVIGFVITHAYTNPIEIRFIHFL